MDKIEFEANAKVWSNSQYYNLRFDNFRAFAGGSKGDKLDRKLHVRNGDRFKVTIEKVKA